MDSFLSPEIAIQDSGWSDIERLFADHRGTAVMNLFSNILVVEDDEQLGASMIQLLAADDRDFSYAPSITQAMRLLEARRFDLVLLDYRLPDGTGLMLMEWLRNRHRSEAIVMISGEDAIEAVIGGLRKGAFDYLQKPYHPDQLRRTVESALQKAELARSNEVMRQQLEHSDQLHRYVIESSQDLIYALTPEGIVSYVNKRIESLLGFPREAVIGQPYGVLLFDEDVERAGPVMCERRTGMRSSVNVEIRMRRNAPAVRHGEDRPDNAAVIVALNAMGVYLRGEGGLGEKFVGTYGVARDITDRKRAEELIAFQAYHDQLTQLPNRTLFHDRLELAIVHAQRREAMLGVMFIDLDRFKFVNDSFGHTEGDNLLRGFAHRIKRCLRKGDTLARQGGDEFTILLPDLASVEDARVIADKIFDELAEPFQLGNTDFRATISLGISIYPRDGSSAEQLIQHADIAMYNVKMHGKNNHGFFLPQMDTAHSHRIALERELMHAVGNGELYLEYQPKFSLSRQRIVGVEALVRWRHPVRGIIPPTEFIMIAEECGLIHSISDWVLREACAQLAAWQRSGDPAMQLSLNLSPRDFERDDIVTKVTDIARLFDVQPGTLEIEITENVLLKDTESVSAKLRLLREHGIKVSIDDFGTGYSSLAYLLKLPVNSLKIDRGFVQELGPDSVHHPIVSAIAGVARGFGLHVIAEGVETPHQVSALRAIGCDEMQGYYFGKPVSAEHVSRKMGMLQ